MNIPSPPHSTPFAPLSIKLYMSLHNHHATLQPTTHNPTMYSETRISFSSHRRSSTHHITTTLRYAEYLTTPHYKETTFHYFVALSPNPLQHPQLPTTTTFAHMSTIRNQPTPSSHVTR